MSSTLKIRENIYVKIAPKPIGLDNYYNINIEDYTNPKISQSGYKGFDISKKCSESPNIPNFPGGNTPPDTSYIKLIYLNYLANKSLENKISNFE